MQEVTEAGLKKATKELAREGAEKAAKEAAEKAAKEVAEEAGESAAKKKLPKVITEDGKLKSNKISHKHANRTSGNNSAAQRGKEAHKEFRDKVLKKESKGWKSEPHLIGTDGKIYIPDAVTPNGKIIELKPNTPRGRSRGKSQIKKYKEQLGMDGKVVY